MAGTAGRRGRWWQRAADTVVAKGAVDTAVAKYVSRIKNFYVLACDEDDMPTTDSRCDVFEWNVLPKLLIICEGCAVR